jgi:hypothetical protein
MKRKAALIDGDSILYMLGWQHSTHQNLGEMKRAVKEFLADLSTQTGASFYYGALSCPSAECFRRNIYKVRPYKGTRPKIAEHMEFWKPVITNILVEDHGFQCVKELEADDLVCYLASSNRDNPDVETIICSPDKDVKQIPGKHFDYRSAKFSDITPEIADYLFWCSMIEGDDIDGVAGLPGYGPVKAKTMFKGQLSTNYRQLVELAYFKHFGGEYYASMIFTETYMTLRMVDQNHPLYHLYRESLHAYEQEGLREFVPSASAWDRLSG